MYNVSVSYDYHHNVLDLWQDLNQGQIGFPFSCQEGANPYHLAAKDIADAFSNAGWGLLANFDANPRTDLNVQVFTSGDWYVGVALAPLLGLPNKNSQEELEEFKDFLETFRNIKFEHIASSLSLVLDAVEDQVRFAVVSDHQDLAQQSTIFLNSKIEKSAVLTHWLNEQKENLLKKKGSLFHLCVSLDSVSLFNETEMNVYKQSLKKPKPQEKSRSRRQKQKVQFLNQNQNKMAIKVFDMLRVIQQDNAQKLSDYLDQGVPLNGKYFEQIHSDLKGASLLCLACASNATACVKLLLERGADVNFINESGDGALMVAYKGYPSLEVMKLLIKYHVDVDAKNNYQNTLLFVILLDILQGDDDDQAEEMALLLINAGASLDVPCENQIPPSQIIKDLEISELAPRIVAFDQALRQHDDLEKSTVSVNRSSPSSRI